MTYFEIDVNEVLKELLTDGCPWGHMVITVDVTWHPAEPDVGIFEPIPDVIGCSLNVNGVQYGSRNWDSINGVISHVTGIEQHKIEEFISSNANRQLSDLEYSD